MSTPTTMNADPSGAMGNHQAAPAKVEAPRQIFVVGCPRSGTTLVQSVLASHSQVITFTESHFFDKGFRSKFGSGYRVSVELPTLLQSFLEENEIRLTSDQRQHFEKLHAARASDVLSRWFVQLLNEQAMARGKVCWLEKTPDHVWRIPLIRQAAPDALFVHVLRRPVATVRSLHDASQAWGRPRPWWYSYLHWLVSFRSSMRYLRQPGHYPVFYEDLVTTPDDESRRLLAFVNLPPEADLFTRRTAQLGSMIGSSEAWKSNTFGDIRQPEPRRHHDVPWSVRTVAAAMGMYESAYRIVHAART